MLAQSAPTNNGGAMSRDQKLTVVIEDGVLRISIGVHALAFATENAPEMCDTNITNPEAFARAVLGELLLEDHEDGRTPVMGLLDGAAWRAIENGAEGVVIDSETSRSTSKRDEK